MCDVKINFFNFFSFAILICICSVYISNAQNPSSSQPFPPTLPPFNPHSCCQFDSDVCGLTLSNWKWSAQYTPTEDVPYPTGNYLWTNQIKSGLRSSIQYNVTNTTTFSFDYYNTYASNAYLYIYFRQESSGNTNMMSSLFNTYGWTTPTLRCDQCCDEFPCNGELLLTVGGTYMIDFVVAIDNIGRDGSCKEMLPCCDFNDDGMCGFQTADVDGFEWKYAGENPPVDPPSSQTDYVYFESVNYAENVALDVTLESASVTVNLNTKFTGNIYVRNNETTKNNNLLVVFVNAQTGDYVPLDYVEDTFGTFTEFTFACQSSHGSCCPDANDCTGNVEIIAHLEALGGTVMYAVDSFDYDDTCE